LDHDNYEILVLPDQSSERLDGIKLIPTGPATPGKKRNVGMAEAKGDFFAFIDSDAYPQKDWLKNAMKYFEDPAVGGVGGPGITPEEDSLMQKGSGHVLSSFMVGSFSRRYKAENIVDSDDIHSCNFIARKSVLLEAGGWNEDYWPGEDTLMCLALKKIGIKLIEAPNVIIFHHRKPLFTHHLNQISRFGLHRGFFAKKFPSNSMRFSYFVPSLLVLLIISSPIAGLVGGIYAGLAILMGVMYIAACLLAALLEATKIRLIPVIWAGIVSTHLVYGLSFLVGLMRSDLKKANRSPNIQR